jgi:hypothetical protein
MSTLALDGVLIDLECGLRRCPPFAMTVDKSPFSRTHVANSGRPVDVGCVLARVRGIGRPALKAGFSSHLRRSVI